MAFKKVWTDADTGISGEYWQWMTITYNQAADFGEATYGCWISKTHKDAGKKPITTRVVIIPGAYAPGFAESAEALCDGFTRAQADFLGSEDA